LKSCCEGSTTPERLSDSREEGNGNGSNDYKAYDEIIKKSIRLESSSYHSFFLYQSPVDQFIVTMTRAYSVNDDLPNNPPDGLPHLIMYCPRNPITFDPNSTNPTDYVLAKVPKLVHTLEWLLPSPCPVHQFDEPPVSSLSSHLIFFSLCLSLQIIVEIEHLTNLHYDE
jgi:hypothetical protein